ncbi:unnamed protein product, partial [Mesorhabditis belari]|uniref:Uncharacterized protein n=1 Tax=Mesorhabditis belari TaxID=2138241 RepID=A0AAF3EIB8_9BILA
MFNAFEKDWEKVHVEAKRNFDGDKWLEFLEERYSFILDYIENILPPILDLLNSPPEEVKMCCQLYPQIYNEYDPVKVESIGDYHRIHMPDVVSRIYTIPLVIIAHEKIKSIWLSIEDSCAYTSPEKRKNESRKQKIMTLWHRKTAREMEARPDEEPSPIAKKLQEIFAIYNERYSLTADWASNLNEFLSLLGQAKRKTGKSVSECSAIMEERCDILMDYVKNVLPQELVKRNLKSQNFKQFVWFSDDGKFAYTSPERNASDEEKKRVREF